MNCLIRNASVFHSLTLTYLSGDLLVRDGRIADFGNSLTAPDGMPVFDAKGQKLLPGLVDVHTHGRAGGDFSTADGVTLRRMSESYLASGVTTVMPTLASAPVEDLCAAIDRINALADEGCGAHIAGIHLEGRYLNPTKRGAHAPHLLASLDPDELSGLLHRMKGAKHISAALELDQNGEFLARALACGATVGLGHTAATYAEATDLISRGVSAMTHLFNAMPPLHHRDGGAVAAGLLSHTALCELICDGFHIAPETVRLAYQLAGERLVLITDSMEATGCPDGEYSIAGMPVTVTGGKARTHDGAIAGSTLSMWEAVLNLRDFAEISFERALYAATLAPAREIGLDGELGSIELGKRADLLMVDENFAITRVMCGGVWADD